MRLKSRISKLRKAWLCRGCDAPEKVVSCFVGSVNVCISTLLAANQCLIGNCQLVSLRHRRVVVDQVGFHCLKPLLE